MAKNEVPTVKLRRTSAGNLRNFFFIFTIIGVASIFIVTGTRVIKTETIERINESDEGSMQNVGKLFKEP